MLPRIAEKRGAPRHPEVGSGKPPSTTSCAPHLHLGKRSPQAPWFARGLRRQGCRMVATASLFRDARATNLEQPGPRSGDANVGFELGKWLGTVIRTDVAVTRH